MSGRATVESMTRPYWALGLVGITLLAVLVGLIARAGESDVTVQSIPLSQGATAILLDARTDRSFITTVPSTSSNGMGHVTVLDTSAQRLLRTVNVRWNPIAIAVDPGVGHVFVANNGDSSLSMLNASTGRNLHTIPLGNAPQAIAMDEHDHRVFVSWFNATTYGRVGVIDTRTGQLVKTIRIPYSPGAIAVDASIGRVIVLGTPLHDAGHVAIIDALTDHLLHVLTLNQSLRAVAVSGRAHRALIVGQRGDGLGILNFVDLRSGQFVRGNIIGRSPVSVTVDDAIGRAFIADSSDNHMRILNAINGHVLSNSPIGPGAVSVAVEPHHQYAFVTNAGPTNVWGRYVGRGTVRIIDTRDGHIRDTIPMTGNPIAAAVDERTGRGFIAIYGGATPSDAWGWMPRLLRRWLPAPRPSRTTAGSVSVIEVGLGLK